MNFMMSQMMKLITIKFKDNNNIKNLIADWSFIYSAKGV